MIDLLVSAAGLAVDTVAYLWAWWGLPIWAYAAAGALLWAGRSRPLDAWARSESRPRRLAGVFLLAVARPFGGSAVRRQLARLAGRPGATALYLAAGHGLTVYYFFLLGPLLGKDVLLSHVLGFGAFAALAALFARLLGVAADEDRPGGRGGAPAAGPGGPRLLRDEALRYVGWSAWGLAVGGLVGAAGLADPSLFLTDLLPGEGLARQALHGAAGLLAAPLTFMGPVATLFAGTFLWKTGLAHAGLVTFFCAATLSPSRLQLYRGAWGAEGTLRWGAALAAAAVLAGLAVAVAFGLVGLEIHYKLTPGQLWAP